MQNKHMDKREKIINVFIELLSSKEMDKITINDIANGAHVSRQTFYNYFPDKYVLLQTIYRSDFDHEVASAKGTTKTYIDVWYSLLKKRRTFYIHAFNVYGTDSIFDFLVNLHHKRAIEIIRQSGIVLTEKQKLRLKIYNYGSVAMIKDLLINGTKLSGDELDRIFIDAAPKPLQRAWGFYTHEDLNIGESELY